MGLMFAAIVYWAPSTKSEEGVYPFYFYVVVLLAYAVHQVRYVFYLSISG